MMAAAVGMKITRARQSAGQNVAALKVGESPANASSEEFSAVDRCFTEPELSASGSFTNQLLLRFQSRPCCQFDVIHLQTRSAWITFGSTFAVNCDSPAAWNRRAAEERRSNQNSPEDRVADIEMPHEFYGV